MNRRLGKVDHEELLVKTLAKYDDEEAQNEIKQAIMIKETFTQQKEALKFKRLKDDEPYEDGDNFDAHVGKFRVITNPYQLLEK